MTESSAERSPRQHCVAPEAGRRLDRLQQDPAALTDAQPRDEVRRALRHFMERCALGAGADWSGFTVPICSLPPTCPVREACAAVSARAPVRLRDHVGCERRTFVEQIAGLTRRYSRWTERLRSVLAAVGLALAGRAGARMASVFGVVRQPKHRAASKGTSTGSRCSSAKCSAEQDSRCCGRGAAGLGRLGDLRSLQERATRGLERLWPRLAAATRSS